MIFFWTEVNKWATYSSSSAFACWCIWDAVSNSGPPQSDKKDSNWISGTQHLPSPEPLNTPIIIEKARRVWFFFFFLSHFLPSKNKGERDTTARSQSRSRGKSLWSELMKHHIFPWDKQIQLHKPVDDKGDLKMVPEVRRDGYFPCNLPNAKSIQSVTSADCPTQICPVGRGKCVVVALLKCPGCSHLLLLVIFEGKAVLLSQLRHHLIKSKISSVGRHPQRSPNPIPSSTEGHPTIRLYVWVLSRCFLTSGSLGPCPMPWGAYSLSTTLWRRTSSW